MLSNHSGRGSPAKPGRVGVRTQAREASAEDMPATVCGPPPPCKTSIGRPLPRSSMRTVKPSAKDSLRVLGGEGGTVLMEFILSVVSIYKVSCECFVSRRRAIAKLLFLI